MSRPRAGAYRTPEYEKQGDEWVPVGARYFGTVKETKAFAVEQMKMRGGKGYTYDSLTRAHIIDLLAEHAPLPEYWR